MTRALRWRASDLTRAVVAMRKAGERVTGARIEPDGSILVLTELGQPAAACDRNPLDRLHD